MQGLLAKPYLIILAALRKGRDLLVGLAQTRQQLQHVIVVHLLHQLALVQRCHLSSSIHSRRLWMKVRVHCFE